MRRKSAFIITIFLLSNLICCFSQETLTITKPMLDTVSLKNKLIITYDILNTKPDERYNVSLQVTDSRGANLNLQTVRGDIGDNIKGGMGKKIIWDYFADNVKEEVEIYIKIIIRKYQAGSDSQSIVVRSSNITRGSLLLQSVALPGLGLSKLNKNKPYWIMGVAGYGLVASSIIFNSASKSNYNKFLDSYDPQEEDSYYKKYKNQKTFSLVSVVGAATIWITDFIIVLHASSKPGNLSNNNYNKKIVLAPGYVATSNALILELKYKF